ncbi:MAG: DNA gyrase inhibitor YacG [Bdellovibrionales bacterium]|nr:DNA gyrase inhibitor YacG [Bdellovibrionales bacterium]
MRILTCPYCRKNKSSLEKGVYPFCSERCKTLDLGAWARQDYRIAAEELPSEEDLIENSVREDTDER